MAMVRNNAGKGRPRLKSCMEDLPSCGTGVLWGNMPIILDNGLLRAYTECPLVTIRPAR